MAQKVKRGKLSVQSKIIWTTTNIGRDGRADPEINFCEALGSP